MINLLRTNNPGTKIEVKLKRSGEMKTIEMELGECSSSTGLYHPIKTETGSPCRALLFQVTAHGR